MDKTKNKGELDKMRIGVFFNNKNLPASGGAFTQREAILESIIQSKTKHEMFYFFYGNKPTELKLSNCVSLNKKIFAWGLKELYYATGFEFFKKIIPLNKALKENKIDLLYFVEPNYQPVTIPYIASVWDIAHLYIPFFPEMRENLYQRALRKATYVITSTNLGKSELEKLYLVPREKIKVIKSPIADVFFEKQKNMVNVHKKYSLPKKYFLYPAQMWSHKNHVLILEALKLAKQEIHVAFVGSNKGNQEYIAKQAKNLGIQKQVHFLGFVPDKDLTELYKQATGLLYVTFLGVEGLPVAEAFVLGCPVIVSKTKGLIEQVGNAGLKVSLTDPKELKTALILLSNNELLRQSLIKKGYKIARELKKEKFAKNLFSVFDEFKVLRKRWE